MIRNEEVSAAKIPEGVVIVDEKSAEGETEFSSGLCVSDILRHGP